METIFHAHKGRYGYRRVACVLRKEGHRLNHKTVRKLMTALQLKSPVRSKKYRSYKGMSVRLRPISCNATLSPSVRIKMGNGCDGVPGGENKLYLSAVLDLYNGEIIAYELARRAEFRLVKSMLDKALSTLKPGEQPVLHSDSNNADVSLYHHLVCRLTRLV